jgi:hypothetical protein
VEKQKQPDCNNEAKFLVSLLTAFVDGEENDEDMVEMFHEAKREAKRQNMGLAQFISRCVEKDLADRDCMATAARRLRGNSCDETTRPGGTLSPPYLP